MEQSSNPWRVFDAPGAPGPGGQTEPGTSAPGAPGSSTTATNQRLALAGVLGAVAIGGLALVIAVSGPAGEIVDGPSVVAGVSGAARSGDPGSAAGEIVVDVTGAVVEPGVYRLAIGSRVGDAIAVAGGFSPRVDVERVGAELNLAAMLADGAQIRVPSRDDPGPVGGSGGSGGSQGGGGGGGSAGQLVNLNTASQSELESLPGIGPVTAVKIIDSRAGSPFSKVEELRERGLVGEKTFESIRALVSVG